MNSAAVDQVFSVPFRHLWSTNFSGDQSVSQAPPSGLARFVGDESNLILKYFSLNSNLRQSTPSSSSEYQWPLVLFGPSGTGKTSLAMTLVSDLVEDSDSENLTDTSGEHSSKALFLTALDFDRRYRSAMETDSVIDFRKRLLSCAGLVIDDIHRLLDKPATQNELVLLLDKMCQKNRPFVVTSDQSPQSINGLSAQLVSRLSCGLVLPVHPPGMAARVEIIRDLCNINDVQLTDDATRLIAERLIVTAPKLVHVFAQIKTTLRAENDDSMEPIDSTKLTRLFKKSDQDTDQLTRQIIACVSNVFHLKPAELKSNSRKQSIVLARGIAIYLNRKLLGTSFLKIGSYFGNRDHSTIMHSFRKIEKLISDTGADPETVSTRSTVESLQQQLTEKFASQINFI